MAAKSRAQATAAAKRKRTDGIAVELPVLVAQRAAVAGLVQVEGVGWNGDKVRQLFCSMQRRAFPKRQRWRRHGAAQRSAQHAQRSPEARSRPCLELQHTFVPRPPALPCIACAFMLLSPSAAAALVPPWSLQGPGASLLQVQNEARPPSLKSCLWHCANSFLCSL